MKSLLAILLISFSSHTSLATAQFPDKIFYKGVEYSLDSNPMEDFFKKNPDKKPRRGIISTALWRGYIATFEIVDNQLFLRDISIEVEIQGSKEFDTKWESVMNEIFPGEKNVKVEWFTGLLVLPYGKMINYVHMGYASTFENYILLEISDGYLKKEKQYKHTEYEEFKEKQFIAFKQTDEYKKLKSNLQQKGISDEHLDSFLKMSIVNYTSKILIE
jgi:hypothetical protein